LVPEHRNNAFLLKGVKKKYQREVTPLGLRPRAIA